ncbi:MAG: hypothetical protein EA381_17050 [Planctomycetaceae bacterium]|nr:MAG: hypothetical protein EA381_17050 [Planctomycetaceae bacterium]
MTSKTSQDKTDPLDGDRLPRSATSPANSMPAGESPTDWIGFLGGADLEMATIAELLARQGIETFDRELGWGAKASAYADEIAATIRRGKIPVLIELEPDLAAELIDRCLLIDHHGERAGRDAPTSLEQIHSLLRLPESEWSRWDALVAANDRGYITAMRALVPPASDEEIRQVRQQDLAAQGVTAEQLDQARQAATLAELLCDGRLTLVQTAVRGGLVAEMLEPFFGGPGFINLLVVGPATVAFFGQGALVQALVDASPPPPDAWFGGALPDSGFWGANASRLNFDPAGLLAAHLDTD